LSSEVVHIKRPSGLTETSKIFPAKRTAKLTRYKDSALIMSIEDHFKFQNVTDYLEVRHASQNAD
jgi:hypothetical protein